MGYYKKKKKPYKKRRTNYLTWKRIQQYKNKETFHRKQANYYRQLGLKLRR